MTPLNHFILEALFVFSVIFIWIMVMYQFVLCIGGYIFYRKQQHSRPRNVSHNLLPSVSILIPAHNEEKVIDKLLERLIDLDYPREKLEIIVINDNCTDGTSEILAQWKRKAPNILGVNMPWRNSGAGKAAALNYGLKFAHHDVIAVYDADNWPERDSLIQLCSALIRDKNLAAATGKFRAYNRNHNLLTRLINIESIAFQWIIQAGRWQFLKIAFLPGTNFVIHKSVLEELGGWDEEALTEDTELSFRIYERGYRILFLPSATTWEQEPERISTWVRQRTRWARGNNYILSHHGPRLLSKRPQKTSLEILNLLYLYYLFIFAILISDLLFILSLFKIVHIRMIGPYAELWALAYILFTLEILLALSFEKEDSLKVILPILLSYLTYTKLWIFVVIRSLYLEFIIKKERTWEKTERFDPVGYGNIREMKE